MVPRATYRVQFCNGFGFDAAAALAPYLAELGISHVYASPYLKARPNSAHGYDITDHNSLNPELGDEASFLRMIDAFKQNGLNHILDYVPNHMGVGGADNPFWLDVLEWGRDSLYAEWFDIDWESHAEYLHDKLLVPFLAGHYGDILTDGKLRLKFDAAAGEFAVWAHDVHKLPIHPAYYPEIIKTGKADLDLLRSEFAGLGEQSSQTIRRAGEIKKQLAQLVGDREDVRYYVESSIAQFDGIPGDPRSWQNLDALIRKQRWRPAYFRVAADDINYRRFFNINELAGIRMEFPAVFEHSHRFVLGLLRDGILDGLRIDHIDGLFDPKKYLCRLREAGGEKFYLVVEKILAHHESLSTDWPIDGTTGYEFAAQVVDLLVDPAAEASLSETYQKFTGEARPFAEIVHAAKTQIMEDALASELLSLAIKAARIARQSADTADFTQNLFRRAIKEITACFPVYRTYVDLHGASETDRRYIHWAIAQAARNEPELDKSAFEFLEKLMTGDLAREPDGAFKRNSVVTLAMKIQQYSGPVMAKGYEDTALFRFNRFAALNEVGGTPDLRSAPVQNFHKANTHRAQDWPHTMLASSTHDTKHGEDARARLAALSLVPEEWATRVNSWSRILRARRGDVEASSPPSHNDEYLLFQNLIATWPAESTAAGGLEKGVLADYTERLKNATIKSMREARLETNWIAPDTDYENAVTGFISDALNRDRSEAFFANFLPFQERIARFAVHNSLAQTVLKMTSPGIPDIYQGSELWNLSLVDPDNRRAVDYAKRQELLRQIKGKPENLIPAELPGMLRDWQDGGIKLFVTYRLLQFRNTHRELFESGNYSPCAANGPSADRICAFTRRMDKNEILTIVSNDARLTRDAFQGTRLILPERPGPHFWKDLFTGKRIRQSAHDLPLDDVFAHLPFAVLNSCAG